MTRTVEIELPKHEGHINYPTWNVMLWVENEEWSYLALQRLIKTWGNTPSFQRRLKHHLRNYIQETRGHANSCYDDIRDYARSCGKRVDYMINRIDYADIANGLLAEVRES
jgi:hypothetical protein